MSRNRRILVMGFVAARGATHLRVITAVLLLTILLMMIWVQWFPGLKAASGPLVWTTVTFFGILCLVWVYIVGRIPMTVRNARIAGIRPNSVVFAGRAPASWLAARFEKESEDYRFVARSGSGISFSADSEGVRLWTNPFGRPAEMGLVPWTEITSVDRSGSWLMPRLALVQPGSDVDLGIACLNSHPFRPVRRRGRSFTSLYCQVERLANQAWQDATQ